jgi:hypothetical protein
VYIEATDVSWDLRLESNIVTLGNNAAITFQTAASLRLL